MKAPYQAETIARNLVKARLSATALIEYPGVMPESLDEAYAVQDAAIPLMDRAIVGWKVGRIMPPLSACYGCERLSGPIFAGTAVDEGAPGAIFVGGFGAAEAEYLLRVGRAPAVGQTHFTLDQAADLIDAVHIGIEIASSPFVGINEHGPTVTISDFGNNNGIIIGPAIDDWRSQELDELEVTTRIDGMLFQSGRAGAFPDGIVGSARFLIANLVGRGIAIQPGWWISSGAVTGVHSVTVGQRVEADFGHLGIVACTISAQLPQVSPEA